MSDRQDPVEGRLDILLDAPAAKVAIHSSRPVTAAQVFEGRSADETLRLLPLLFSVCGQAQATAAVRAVEAALEETPPAATEEIRDRLVILETVREHLWRVLLDWPRFYAGSPTMQQVNGLMAAVQRTWHALDPERLACRSPACELSAPGDESTEAWEALADEAGEAVFGEPAGLWLARDVADIETWLGHEDTAASQLLRFVRRRDWGGIGPSDAPPLRPLEPSHLRRHLDSDAADRYLADPTGFDGANETGTTARQLDHPLVADSVGRYGRGLYTRLLARLVELARLLSDPASLAGSASADGTDGDGLSQLEAARGRLCHRVLLDDGYVARYQVLAPTEWNFGASGPAVDGLTALLGDEGPVVQAQAELLIHAIDPCVGFDLRIESD